nr:BTB/POZ domain-containing protein At1g67900-like [Ipomoea batatas]
MHSRKCWSHVASMQQEGRRRKVAFFSDGVIPKDFISDEEEKESEITKVSCRVLLVSTLIRYRRNTGLYWSQLSAYCQQKRERFPAAAFCQIKDPESRQRTQSFKFIENNGGCESGNLSKDWYLPFIHKQINRLVCVCDCGLTEEVTPYQYDVDIVMIMLEEFLLQGKSPGSDNPPRRSKGDFAFTTTVPKENSK